MQKNVAALMAIAAIAGLSPFIALAYDSASAEVRVNAGGQGERRDMSKDGERRMDLEARIGDMKTRIEGRGEEMREKFASSSAAFKARLEDGVKERVQKHADTIYLSLTAALDRLAAFETKVEARLDELADAGVDVSLSREKLAVAADVRADAAANIADLEADLEAALDGETSRSEVVALVRAAREELASVRTAYAEVLIQIRADVKASKED